MLGDDLLLTDQEKWHLLFNSLIGGYRDSPDGGYAAIQLWLSRFDTLDAAFEAAMKQRDGMICT